MKQVGVFISYSQSDGLIAQSIYDALTRLSPFIQIFLDHGALAGSDNYEEAVISAISNSDWFILINAWGNDALKRMEWSFYEAGQFRAHAEAQGAENRRICLYEVKIPAALQNFIAVKVSRADRDGQPLDLSNSDSVALENTDLFRLFAEIVRQSDPLRNLSDRNVRQLLRESVGKVIKAFRSYVETLKETAFRPPQLQVKFARNSNIS